MMKWKLWSVLFIGAILASCGTHRPRPGNPDPTQARAGSPSGDEGNWNESSLDIQYILGHSHRHIHMQSVSGQARAQVLVDRTLMKENPIEASRYRDFMRKVAEFIDHKRTPAMAAVTAPGSSTGVTPPVNPGSLECRSPYTITLRSGKESYVVNGCRMSEDGSFSHIVKDSEFLVYSQR